VSTLGIILLVVVVLVLILVAGGVVITRRRAREYGGRRRAELEAANQALATAHAEDKGWHRERLERAAREAFAGRSGASVRELGIRPSIFVDIGALWGVRTPELLDIPPGDPRLFSPTLDASGSQQCTDNAATPTVTPIPPGGCPTGTVLLQSQVLSPFREVYLGDSPSPRLSIGFGVNWNSPFGPFRIDIARALLHQRGDDTKLFTFNVGTAF